MPVPDTEPHPLTVRPQGHKPSCFDREPFALGQDCMDRHYDDDRGWKVWFRYYPHTMTTECQAAKERYKECEGCKHQKEKEE